MGEVQYIRLQLLGGDNSYWNINKNQVLKNRELGYNSTTGELKLGDGTSTWSNLKGFKEPVPFYINSVGGSYINGILSLPNQSTLYYNNGESYGNPDYNKRGWYIYNESLRSTPTTKDPRTHGLVRILTVDDANQFVSINPSTFQIINNLGSIILEDDYISIYSEDSGRQNKSASLTVDEIILEDKNGLEVQLNFPEHSGTITLNEDLNKVAADLRLETNSIRAALDLAEITATIEIEDKYNYRQTADGLTSLWEGQPTTLLKVEGDTTVTINKLNPSTFPSNITVFENGKILSMPQYGSHLSFALGLLKNAIPSVHTGDVVYLYCTSANLPNGLVDGNNSVIIPINTATTITAEMLDTEVYLGVPVYSEPFNIEGLQITKVQNAPWTPYFEGLKSAEFAGVESVGDNFFDYSAITPQEENDIKSVTEREIVVENPGGMYVSNIGKTLKDICPNLNVGIAVYLNADTDIASINMYGINGKSGAWVFGDAITIEDWMLNAALKFAYPDTNAKTYSIKDLRITRNQNAPWSPYVSKTFSFPNTVNPLGQTIDFENKKIVDYGVELVFDGTEDWRYTNNWNINGAYVYGLMPTSEIYARPAVVTDGTLIESASGIGYWAIGRANTTLVWEGCLDYLGFTTEGTTPTEEEKATAIANFKAYLAERYADGNPVTIRYKASELQSETPFTAEQISAGDSYLPYTGGTETVDNANAEYGVENTITQEYEIINKIGG